MSRGRTRKAVCRVSVSSGGSDDHRRHRRLLGDMMSQTASTLLLRNLHDVFGEIDSVRRRAAIDEIFHEDAVFYEPNGTKEGQVQVLERDVCPVGSFVSARPNSRS